MWIRSAGSASSPSIAEGYYLALHDSVNETWAFSSTGDDLATADVALAELVPGSHELRIIIVSVSVAPLDSATVPPFTSPDLPLDPDHKRAGSPDSLFDYFSEDPASINRARTLPIVFRSADIAGFDTGVEVLNAFFNADPNLGGSPPSGLQAALEDPDSSPAERRLAIVISGGNDGNRPQADEYAGQPPPTTARPAWSPSRIWKTSPSSPRRARPTSTRIPATGRPHAPSCAR